MIRLQLIIVNLFQFTNMAVLRGFVMLKRRPCRLQTGDCANRADCADCADWVLFFYLYLNFLVKYDFYYSFLLPLIMCTVHHHHMCTDVYLQGSWIGNEKIMGSCFIYFFSRRSFFQVKWLKIKPFSASYNGYQRDIIFLNFLDCWWSSLVSLCNSNRPVTCRHFFKSYRYRL